MEPCLAVHKSIPTDLSGYRLFRSLCKNFSDRFKILFQTSYGLIAIAGSGYRHYTNGSPEDKIPLSPFWDEAIDAEIVDVSGCPSNLPLFLQIRIVAGTI